MADIHQPALLRKDAETWAGYLCSEWGGEAQAGPDGDGGGRGLSSVQGAPSELFLWRLAQNLPVPCPQYPVGTARLGKDSAGPKGAQCRVWAHSRPPRPAGPPGLCGPYPSTFWSIQVRTVLKSAGWLSGPGHSRLTGLTGKMVHRQPVCWPGAHHEHRPLEPPGPGESSLWAAVAVWPPVSAALLYT